VIPGAGMSASHTPVTRVIVTRPARECLHWVEQLQQSGFAAEALPLIEIGPADSAEDVQAIQQAWKTLDAYAACLFVSGNAVSYFFKQNKPLAHVIRAQEAIKNIADQSPTSLPPQLRFMAPGPGTAAALMAEGVPAEQIDGPAPDAAQFDSQALWATVGARDWQGCRVLIVRGHTRSGRGDASLDSSAAPGRDWIARQWNAAGATVDFLRVYVRRAPQLSAALQQRAQAASRDGSVWLLSSSEAVDNLKTMRSIDLRAARAVATHPRIAEAARAAGWGVVVQSRPQIEDITAALQKMASGASIELGHP
jgi:uroporphyrinogen-III synthase